MRTLSGQGPLYSSTRIVNARAAGAGQKACGRKGTFMDVFEERRPLYIKYADHIINCSGKTADEIAMEIINTLEKMYDE